MAESQLVTDVDFYVVCLENLYVHKDSEKLGNRILRMFSRLGLVGKDIIAVVLEDRKGVALVYLRTKAVQDYILQVFSDVRDVMNFYDIRKLTSEPMGLKVSKRRDRSSISPRRLSPSRYTHSYVNMDLQSSTLPPVATTIEMEENTSPAGRPENVHNQHVHFQGDPSQNVTREAETSSTTTSATMQLEFQPLAEDEESRSSNSNLSRSKQRHVVMLDASTSLSGFPNNKLGSHSGEISSNSQNKGTAFMVDVKTSTPQVSPCFCPETVFYHKNQHVGSETRHAEFKRGGVVFDLRSFRTLVGRYLCAFLNTEGGVIYFGVTDDGKAVGIEVTQKLEDDIRLAIDNAVSTISPPVATSEYTINFAKVMNQEGQIEQGLKVLEVCVHPRRAPRTLHSFDNHAYVRRDGSLRTV